MYKIGKDNAKIMTAQIPDYCIYKNDEYRIVALSKPMNFNPEDYGIKIDDDYINTACYRGYWCIYCIENKTFFLKDLNIKLKDDVNKPTFRGIHAIQWDEYDFEQFNIFKRKMLVV